MGLRFVIKGIRADLSESGGVSKLHELDIQCLRCLNLATVGQGSGLVDLDGAGVLTCPTCGEHQAISRKRLEEVTLGKRLVP